MINKKIIVSLGDPAGIGPEIFLKALSKINSKEIFEKIVTRSLFGNINASRNSA